MNKWLLVVVLMLLAVDCPVDSTIAGSVWPQTLAGTNATSTCTAGYYSSGVPQRFCTQSGSVGNWQSIVNACAGELFAVITLFSLFFLSSPFLTRHKLFFLFSCFELNSCVLCTEHQWSSHHLESDSSHGDGHEHMQCWLLFQWNSDTKLHTIWFVRSVGICGWGLCRFVLSFIHYFFMYLRKTKNKHSLTDFSLHFSLWMQLSWKCWIWMHQCWSVFMWNWIYWHKV